MSSGLVLQYIIRFLLILALSIGAVWLVSEAGLMLQNENTARAPMDVELVIPAGTAARVAAGEEAPTIPEEMTFVLGDPLVVRNEDSEAHILGPLIVPANGTASQRLDTADNFAWSCSINPSKTFGLNVKIPTTLKTRLLGIAFAAPPTAVMLFVYSLIVFPVKPASKAPKAGGTSGS
jgi:hypothetical protein